MEIWKYIEGYEHEYQVSSIGHVKSLKFGKERILTPCKTIYGYYHVPLSMNGKIKTIPIHKLVAIAFLNHKPCGHKLVVNHINHEITDNRVENLEIITQRENTNKKHLLSSSKYTGVNLIKNNGKWRSNIYINGKLKHLGIFYSELEASNAYQKALGELTQQRP